MLLPLWASYLVRVYSWRLILNKTAPSTGGSASSGCPTRTSRYTNWAMWLVFTYVWFPFMVLPVYAALERDPVLLRRGLAPTSVPAA